MAQTDASPQGRELPSLARRWYVLAMMTLVYTMSIADRYAISTVQEAIRLEMKLSDFAVNLLTAWPLALFYVGFGFPLAWLIDRYSRRFIIVVSLLGWSVMTWAVSMTRSYWQLLTTRVGVGIGEAGGTPGANSLLSDYFPADRRPMALTIFALGAPIGAWLAQNFAGAVADAHGWRAVFLALGLPGVILALLIWFTVREPPRGQFDVKKDADASFGESMRFLTSQRSAVHLMVGSALTAFWGWGLMWDTPTFLIRTYQLTTGEAGAIIGPINLWAGIGATALTGVVLALPVFRDPRRIAWLMGTLIGLATIPSIILYWTHSLAVAKAMLWIFVPTIYFYIGPCFGILNNLAQPRMRGMFCASTLFLANVGNLVIAPPLLGKLSDIFAGGGAPDAASLRLAMLCLAPAGFWAAFHYFWCTRRMAEDQERATGISIATGATLSH
jgi:MFS family permease